MLVSCKIEHAPEEKKLLIVPFIQNDNPVGMNDSLHEIDVELRYIDVVERFEYESTSSNDIDVFVPK